MILQSVLDLLYGGGAGSGCHGDRCGRPKGNVADEDRSERAKATYIPSTRAKQKLALANQDKFASQVGGTVIPDNKPFDVIVGKVGVEIKTLVDQKNDKLTMHPSSLAKKLKDAKAKGLVSTFTVAFDSRPGKGGQLYVREGLGSFRLGAMTPVKDFKELKRFIRSK